MLLKEHHDNITISSPFVAKKMIHIDSHYGHNKDSFREHPRNLLGAHFPAVKLLALSIIARDFRPCYLSRMH